MLSIIGSLKKCLKKAFPVLIIFKTSLYAWQSELNYKRYQSKVKQIRRSHSVSGLPIRVAFLVVFSSVFPARKLFELMLNDSNFDPKIIVVPSVDLQKSKMLNLLDDSFIELSKLYPTRVVLGYDVTNNKFLELGDEYQIVVLANPYSHLVHKFHDLRYFLKRNVLTIYAQYGFSCFRFSLSLISSFFYSNVWTVCLENPTLQELVRKYALLHGKNALLTGYIKMDSFVCEESICRHIAMTERKRVIIAMHHTVYSNEFLKIGNFLELSDFILELPKKFPNVDFILRPHPLLFINIVRHQLWTQSQVDAYVHKLQDVGIQLDSSADYFDIFASSDAMIHDCGSFIAEYLYTGKPCCFITKQRQDLIAKLLPFGQECISNYYLASTQEEIKQFILNVVINGNDDMKQQRTYFVKNKLMYNYPNASSKLLSYIKRELLNDDK